MPSKQTKSVINRAYQHNEEQQRALDEGRITEQEWFDAHNSFFTERYLAADNPRAQSGHSGDESANRYTRGMLLEAIHRDGTFIDIGCANGHLMEMLGRWLSGTDVSIEFYGLDISEGLLNLAKQRLPDWDERFYLGNALYWTPSKRFDFVCIAGLGGVPRDKQKELFDRLYRDFVAPGGRLIFGPSTEVAETHEMESMVREWGYEPTGYCEKSHQQAANVRRRLFWFDKV
jgi:hypothetical protein